MFSNAIKGYRAAGVCAVMFLATVPALAGVYTFTNIVDDSGPFSTFNIVAPSINNAGKVAFWAKLELFPKAVDGRDRLSGDSFSVDEHDVVDQVLELFAAVQLPPA